ncbi:hypothetical protein HispidOSU_013108, partial [Sigmodon hispidus]
MWRSISIPALKEVRNRVSHLERTFHCWVAFTKRTPLQPVTSNTRRDSIIKF